MPSSSPRSVSVIGVTGWFAATARSPARMVSTGTNALDRYGRNSTRKVNPFAPSTVRAISPKHTATQDSASTHSTSIPATGQPLEHAGVRPEPGQERHPDHQHGGQRVAREQATTCPVSTAELRIGIDRNRSTTPSVMSRATSTAVDAAP